MKKSMLHRWDAWYQKLDGKNFNPYGDTSSYSKAANFLKDMKVVEDWGCGLGGYKKFHKGGTYIGVDGSKTEHSDVVADLRKYKSSADGILLRHVLEHNYDWEMVLSSALKSFKKKLCIVIFTPFGSKTREIAHNAIYGVDVPDISFKREDIEKHFKKLDFKLEVISPSETGYGIEYIYYITK